MLIHRPWEFVLQESPGTLCRMACPGSLHVPAPWPAFVSEPAPGARTVVIASEG